MFLLASDFSGAANEAYATFLKMVNTILPILMGVILALGIFYGVQLGMKYSKAEDDEQKKKAKGALINCIVGFVIAIVFVAIIQIVLNADFIKGMFPTVSVGNLA